MLKNIITKQKALKNFDLKLTDCNIILIISDFYIQMAKSA